MKQTEEILDKYLASCGLHKLIYNQEAETILSMRREELERLSEQDCVISAIILSQYATFLQKEYNRHSSKRKWAEHNLNLVVAQGYLVYGDKYVKFDVKCHLASVENEYAKALNIIIRESTIRQEELNFIATRVATISSLLSELKKAKRHES